MNVHAEHIKADFKDCKISLDYAIYQLKLLDFTEFAAEQYLYS